MQVALAKKDRMKKWKEPDKRNFGSPPQSCKRYTNRIAQKEGGQIGVKEQEQRTMEKTEDSVPTSL
jgi:hypothetical protein